MKKVTINEKEYSIEEDYNNGFDQSEVESKLTDYFDEYDYIFGDWAYGKLRLKGFCDPSNKLCNDINHIKNKDSYLKENCAFGCKYFLLKKSV
jgi:uncharacterized protein YutD